MQRQPSPALSCCATGNPSHQGPFLAIEACTHLIAPDLGMIIGGTPMANRSRWMALLDSSLSAAGVRKFKAEWQRRVRLYPGLTPHRGTFLPFRSASSKHGFCQKRSKSDDALRMMVRSLILSSCPVPSDKPIVGKKDKRPHSDMSIEVRSGTDRQMRCLLTLSVAHCPVAEEAGYLSKRHTLDCW
jgi:hypothetical protein